MHLLSLKRRPTLTAATAAGLRGCEGGATVVEFALVAPAFLAILCAIMEFSGIMFVQTLLEGAAREASRYGIIGQGGTCQDRTSKILHVLEDNTYGIIDLDELEMNFRVYESFDEIGQPEPYTDENENGAYDVGEPYQDINANGSWDEDMGTVGQGGPGEVVEYRLSYDWPIMIPLFEPLFGETITLRSNIAVRNEPFPAACI
jgi:hypothetical protein